MVRSMEDLVKFENDIMREQRYDRPTMFVQIFIRRQYDYLINHRDVSYNK